MNAVNGAVLLLLLVLIGTVVMLAACRADCPDPDVVVIDATDGLPPNAVPPGPDWPGGAVKLAPGVYVVGDDAAVARWVTMVGYSVDTLRVWRSR